MTRHRGNPIVNAPADDRNRGSRGPFGRFSFKMRERLMSRISKHGELKENYPHKEEALDNVIKSIEAYIATGNTVYLVDAASCAYIEYEHPSRPKAHYQDTDPNDPLPELVIGI